MSIFYFVRHGEMDVSQAGQKFYKGFAYNMMTLSQKGVGQILGAAEVLRSKNAELIIASPYGRTMHSAAVLSRALDLEIRVETDLHEWLADGVSYEFLPREQAGDAYRALLDNHGRHPENTPCAWESAEQMNRRVLGVLERYRDFHSVIVVCHGTLMQFLLNIEYPQNGQVAEFRF